MIYTININKGGYIMKSSLLELAALTATLGGLSAASDDMPSHSRNTYTPNRNAEAKAKRKKAKLKKIAKRKQRRK